VSGVTILYYTSNREHPEFERRVRETWLRNRGDLPIVTVSQRAIDVPGVRVVVGDVGASNFNMFRQIQRGLAEVTTPFVLSVEADCLYPPDYFTFVPPRLDVCYRNRNVYVMPRYRSFFWHKPEGATHAQIIGTDHYRARLDRLFEGCLEWSIEDRNFPKERYGLLDVFSVEETIYYETAYPVVQLKTKEAMRHYTHSTRVDTRELPYWGTGVDVRSAYLGSL
jgi:hypothetical protein